MKTKFLLLSLFLSFSASPAFSMEAKPQSSVPYEQLHKCHVDLESLAVGNFDLFMDNLEPIAQAHKEIPQKAYVSDAMKTEFATFGNYVDAAGLTYSDALNLDVCQEFVGRKNLVDTFVQKINEDKENTQQFLNLMYEKAKMPRPFTFFLAFNTDLAKIIEEGVPAKLFNKTNSLVLSYDAQFKTSIQTILRFAPTLNQQQKDAISGYFTKEREALIAFNQAYAKSLKAFREKTVKAVMSSK